MSHTKPPANATHQELVLHMVRGHQGCTLIDLKTRMQAEHGSPWKQTENTVARLYRLGLLQNRSTLGHIPCICTPGCKSLPAQVTPDPRAVLAKQAATEKRLAVAASKAAYKAAIAETKKVEPRKNPHNLHCKGIKSLNAPRVANARDLVEHIIRLLLTLGEDERIDAEQVATRLGIPVEVTAVRDALSKMSYHGKVRSRYNAERTRLLYSIDPITAELLRQKAQQATSQPAAEQNTGTEGGSEKEEEADAEEKKKDEIKPGQYNPDALKCDRADAKAFLACPSMRNGKEEKYAGIKGMCTGAAGPIAHTPSRLKQ